MAIVFREYELLAKSGMFDADYYVGANPEIAAINIDPLMHYLERGCREGRNPSAGFDTSHYLRQCKDIGESPTNALLHYLTIGADRGLTPKARRQSQAAAIFDSARLRTPAVSVSAFSGQDTLASLSETVLLEIDDAIMCPPDGVLLKGWLLCSPGCVRSIRICSGSQMTVVPLERAIVVERSDVISAVGKPLGMVDPRCGFIAYSAGSIRKSEITYLEIELQNGEVGFKNLRLSSRSGLDAIERILESVDVRYDEINPAFDRVLGPAISAINAARLQTVPAIQELSFGAAPDRPKCSLVVPLFGRIDFLEYQMALFSRQWNPKQFELIYVLDDPRRRRDLQALAQASFARFSVPFRVLLLQSNLGFGPASNAGLRAARGQYVCFLNSDVFPITSDWIDRLIDRLEKNPDVGIIGPRLLYEDGTVQHEGCYFRQVPEFGDWNFVEHINKGRRPNISVGLRPCDAITGACMLMKRTLALRLGGFDEAYVVGDFEDSDLCLKIRARDHWCAVDDTVELYHLERKSQSSPSQASRMNLTLYNAWRHQRRWFSEPVANTAA